VTRLAHSEVLVNGTVKRKCRYNVIIQPNLGEKKIISLHPRAFSNQSRPSFLTKVLCERIGQLESKLSREHFMSKNILEELNLRVGWCRWASV